MSATDAMPQPKSETPDLLAALTDKEMLRFITCGSVDDGKSTLIGRLLLEAGALHDDQLDALRRDTNKHGTTDDEFDTALLLDGLEDERQQGITIDVAYRYFTTAKRKFIIADTPGHEQFTRNMATGASTADLALILVDASKGILTQTKRHAFIVSLLGIRHVVLAVNKMDLVDFDRSVFESICEDFKEFASSLDVPDIRFVPLSALKGDNVVQPSANTLWYEDGSLLHLLENIYIGSDSNTRDLRFPVQWVNRPDATFRGFSGSIASGRIRVGDEVVVLPSQKTSRIKRIVTHNGDLKEAEAPLSVTITLEDEIDVARGDMIVRPGNRPQVRREIEALLVWMSEQPLATGKSYFMKHTTRKTSAEVHEVRYQIDVNTLHRSASLSLRLNEIGRCQLTLHDPIMVDDYRHNRQTGAFILVDRITNETVAAGLFFDTEGESSPAEHWDDKPQGIHLQRAISHVPETQRAVRYNQQPITILLTGLSGSGKSTIALELERLLFSSGKTCVVLDGQNMRFGISRDLGFSAEERSENLRRAAEIAKILNDSGLICIAAFVAPHQDVRTRAKQLIGPDRLVHIHLDAPVEICRQRDSSGRYVSADRGEISNFPGVTSTYDLPQDATLVLRTDKLSSEQCVNEILELLANNGKLSMS
ncbi:sulfate adenylyltransferase subunit CysN [Bythopirellula polymerisocia]|uniref:Sulfate adenylyltransferase subunit 1 n=1 Tax=Bythopirellula polymerisocia TaxID=2528003 RepID=A0A5C6CZC7_9BACT|nr:sulfate adenylyltransferase subunit CysN [Bythopirellula polymerisocia]TWU29992.1 Bifunctional enzyme CysN/CysC [Bythopirellula polymerisocia]